MFKTKLTVFFAVVMALPVLGQERGAELFRDDFNNYQTSLEHWRINGAKIEDGKIKCNGGGWIVPKFDIPTDFYASMDVNFTSPKNPQGNSRIEFVVDKLLFGVEPEGRPFPAWPKNSGFEAKTITLALIRRCSEKDAEYVFFINGKEVSRKTGKLPQEIMDSIALAKQSGQNGPIVSKMKEPLVIEAYGADGEIDNFVLCGIKGGKELSRNRVLNSSFEYLDSDGFPYFIMREHNNFFNYNDDLPIERILANWAVDSKEKHSGNVSVRMTFEKGMNMQYLGVWGWGLVLLKDEPAVLSVYMKADKPDYPVTLHLAGSQKEVNVGTEWARYELVNPQMPYVSNYYPMSISFKKQEGTVWVDDLQIEVGDKATSYRPSDSDNFKCVKEVKVPRPADIAVPKLPANLKPSADLDSWSSKAVKTDKFFSGQNPAKAKSEAYLACDADNLYIGLRAYVDDSKPIKSMEFPHDDFGVLGGEGIEIFLDPLQDGKFVHFGVNSAGSYADIGRDRISEWNGNWKHEVKENKASKSFDYFITLPLSDFANESLSGEWLFNLARNSVEKGGGCLGKSSNFQKQEVWLKMILPVDIVQPYRFGVSLAVCSEMKDIARYVLTLNNPSGIEHNVKAVLSDAKTGNLLTENAIVVIHGENTLDFVSKTVTDRVTLKLTEGNRIIFFEDAAVKKSQALSVMGRLSFYMKEDCAVFQGKTTLPNPEKLTALLECAGQKTKMPASAKFKISLPLKNIPDGTHKATLTLLNSSEKAAEAETTLIKRPYREHAAQINHFSRSMLVDGKPFFPFTPLCVWNAHPGMFNLQKPDYAEKFIDFWLNHGFKSMDICLEGYKAKDEKYNRLERKSHQVFLDAANKKAMKVMLWTSFLKEDPENWDRLIPIYDQPCVISHRVEDEADRRIASDKLRDFVDTMRPKMPYVPTYMNYTPMGVPDRSADLTPDILECDPYLTNTGEFKPVEAVMADIEALREPCETMGKPLMAILVGCNLATHWREITSAEQVAQTYGAITIGATGLSYFIVLPSQLQHWNAWVQLNREILSADRRYLLRRRGWPPRPPSVKKLRHITKRYDGYVYVISVQYR